MPQQDQSGNEPIPQFLNHPPPRLEIFFLTLFPEIFKPILDSSLLKRAQTKNLVNYHLVQIRDFAIDRNKTVDDSPYGGGAGMILKPDVLYSAWKWAIEQPGPMGMSQTILLSPQGTVLDQELAKSLLCFSRLILICGHYEGVDQRFIDECVDTEISIGDYILTGGELPALVLTDTLTRLIPTVLGNPESISSESLENHLLKYPQYTRPGTFRGKTVPPVLLSGNHAEIRKWRQNEAVLATQTKRPDLFKKW